MRNAHVLALVMLTSACSDSGSSQRATALAASMQALAPKELRGGLTMTGAEAEGDTLVLHISGIPQEFSGRDPDQVQSEIKPGVCNSDGFRRVIQEGVPIRIEMKTTGGDSLPPLTVSEC